MTTVHTDPWVASTLSLLADELTRWHVTGLSIAVVQRGEVVYAGGVGRRHVDDPALVTARTLFHHGSCCKAYTSLLACVLADHGRLDLDEPVRAWVPELRLPDSVLAEQITTRDLLAHRSGLSRHDLTWILNPSWDRQELVQRLEHLPLAAGLRERMEYSNLGYSLAGLVLERVTGTSWDDALRDRVLAPLGMTRTTTSAAHMHADSDAATPHLLRDGRAVPTPARVLVGAAPAGSLMTSADDAARWLLLQLGASGAISAAAVAATHTVEVAMPEGVQPFPHLEIDGYALGWLKTRYRDTSMLWHSGGVDGFSTQTFVLPDKQIGVVVSANLHSTLLSLAAGLQLVDALVGTLDEQSWYDRLHPLTEVAPSTTEATDAMAEPSTAELVGTYSNPGYGDLVLTAVGEGLQARLGESDLSARHLGGDTWELRYDVLDAAYSFTFDTAEGALTAAALLDPSSGPTRFARRETS